LYQFETVYLQCTYNYGKAFSESDSRNVVKCIITSSGQCICITSGLVNEQPIFHVTASVECKSKES
ncbi:unnamed protein product, partial [Tenebrio molitor]